MTQDHEFRELFIRLVSVYVLAPGTAGDLLQKIISRLQRKNDAGRKEEKGC